jgi:hypothetical protein
MAAADILDFRLSRFRWHFRTLLDGTVLCRNLNKSDHKYASYNEYLIFKMAAADILDFRLSRFRWHFRTLLDGTVLS